VLGRERTRDVERTTRCIGEIGTAEDRHGGLRQGYDRAMKDTRSDG
jgi:hypothetical protein